MKTIALSLIAALAVAAAPFTVEAASKSCPDGKVYNPKTKKCVTRRGS